MKKISVIGCGTWGMALAVHLSELGHDVTVWCHSEEMAQRLREEKSMPEAFPEVVFPDYLRYTSDMGKAAAGKDLLVIAVASPFVRSTCEKLAPIVEEGQRIVVVTKGIEEETLMTQIEVLRDVLPGVRAAALSGPTHAEEVIRKMPTAIVAASKDEGLAEYVQDIFMSPYFRVYTSDDELGVELGGSLKNVIALASGMVDGLGSGFGDNIKAAMMTRGIHEMRGLAIRMGAREETLAGLSGIGDLIVTCMSMHSRNHRAGILIARGKSCEEAMKEVGQVVEGYYSAKAAMALAAKYGASMPITEEVNRILFEGKSPKEAVVDLMLRDARPEHSFD